MQELKSEQNQPHIQNKIINYLCQIQKHKLQPIHSHVQRQNKKTTKQIKLEFSQCPGK